MRDGYPLGPDGVYRSIQGEGDLMGVPMVFIRLAGCSVGCPLCDTDYRVASRATAGEIAARAAEVRDGARWAWITGGEPTDHDCRPLAAALRSVGFAVALATSGVRAMPGRWTSDLDYLSVSPHDPGRWGQRAGQELKLVPGLNGFGLDAFEAMLLDTAFGSHWAIPCDGKPETVAECVGFVRRHPRFRVGIQAHKAWGLA